MKLTMKSIKNGTTTLLMGMGVLLTATGALTAASVLTACSGTELNELNGNTGNDAWQNDPDALRISATVGNGFGTTATASSTTATAGSNNPLTRSNPMGDIDDDAATDQTAFRLNDQIGVYTDDQATVIYTLKGADLASAVWTPEDGKYLKWTSDEMQVYAYYPVTSVNGSDQTVKNDAKNFTLPPAQGTVDGIAAADYMTFNGKITRTKGSAALSLPMKRRTARVIINITSVGDEVDKAKDIIGIQAISSAYSKYTDDKPSGNPMPMFMCGDRAGENGFNSETYTRYTALVIPAAVNTTVKDKWLNVSIRYGEGEDDFKSVSVSTIPAMEAGKSYTYNLKVGKDKVTIAGITVQDWATGDTLPDQEAEEVQNP